MEVFTDLLVSLENLAHIKYNLIYNIIHYYLCTICKFIFRSIDHPRVTKFSVLDTESVTGLETTNKRRLNAYKLSLQNDLNFEMLKHKDKANQMIEMGFTDFSTNINALIKSSGCINGAIGKLF